MARTISTDEVATLPRGRKATYDDALLKVLRTVKPGKALVLDEEFGTDPITEKDEKARIGGIIRNHWRHVRDDEVSVKWSPEGYPQVMIRN